MRCQLIQASLVLFVATLIIVIIIIGVVMLGADDMMFLLNIVTVHVLLVNRCVLFDGEYRHIVSKSLTFFSQHVYCIFSIIVFFLFSLVPKKNPHINTIYYLITTMSVRFITASPFGHARAFKVVFIFGSFYS